MSEECCTTESCATTQKTNSDCGCDMPEKSLVLADEAWMELLKEKIKVEIEKANGPHMDKIAKLVADANCAKWGNMIKTNARCNEYKEGLKALMIGGCDK